MLESDLWLKGTCKHLLSHLCILNRDGSNFPLAGDNPNEQDANIATIFKNQSQILRDLQ
jgi:hypothetical protein